jgi:zinc protease
MNRSLFVKSAPYILATSLCALSAGVPVMGASAGVTSAPEKVRTIEGVTEYRLANGLQILLYPDESSTTLSINVTYRVGSRHESYGETGMAHLLEHLMFKGTPAHPKIPDELTSHGAQANATTAEDRTNYFETLPASPANLEWAFTLEADRMTHSFIAQKDLDSEMTVVRNEFERGENDPTRILRERVLETAYLWHNYGHPTIGARADIEHVPIKRLQAFYHTYYQPDDATLIVTGRFDATHALQFIEKTFGAIPKPTRILPNLYTEEPTQDGEREVTLRRAGGQKVLIEAFHIPADAQADSAALGLLAGMLDDKPSGRLYKQLIETKLATQASVSPNSAHDPGTMIFTVVMPKDGDLAGARKALGEVIDSLATEPFTAAELDRARTQQLNGYERLMNSSPDVASNLSENVAEGDWRLLFWDRDQMTKVTLADLQRVSAAYLVTSNLTLGTFIPDEHPLRATIPAAPPLNALLNGFTGNAAVEAGEHFDATPANIEARTTRGTAGSLQTAYLEKKTKGGRVNAVLNLHFGDTASLQHKADIGVFTAALLMRGTQNHTRQQLDDELTRLKATMNVNGGANGVTVAFETTKENLPEVLRLAAELLQHPAFPADQLDEIKRAQLAQIQAARTEPQPLAGQTVRRSLSAYGENDFRYVPTFAEQAARISTITATDLQQFHKQFYGASHGEIALVGTFDTVATTRLLQELFATWQSASPYQRAVGIYKATHSGSETIATPDKPNAVFISAGALNLSATDPNYPPLEVGNAILGGGFLNSRLAMRIRQQDGLSYTVVSSVKVDSQDPVGSFSVFAICAPQNIAKVEKDAREEIARALKDGFTAEEISAAKSGLLQSRVVARSSDNQLAGDLAEHLYLDRHYTWDAKFEQDIEKATPDAIQNALHRFIDPSQMITVKAGDIH